MAISFSISAPSDYVEKGGQFDIDTMDPVDAAFQIAQSHPGGVANLAQRMGMNAGTLQNKLNPNNTTHHLTLKEAVMLQVAANNAAILQAMAAQLGFTCSRATPDQAGGDPVEMFMRLQSEFAELVRAAADALQGNGAVNRNELRRIEYQANEAIAAIGHLVATLRARLPSHGEG